MQQIKMSINKCIASFKSAQVEGYRYEIPAVTTKRTISHSRKEPKSDSGDKQWTDVTIKAVIDECSAGLRGLTGDLLAKSEASSSVWTTEAVAAIQLRMQIAKAWSDFGLVSQTSMSETALRSTDGTLFYVGTAFVYCQAYGRDSAASNGLARSRGEQLGIFR